MAEVPREETNRRMEQIRRITRMEAALDEAAAAVASLSQALEGYDAVRERLQELEEYYSGPQWLADFDDDAAGRLPEGLKRGVLSEDAVYDLLARRGWLLERRRWLAEL